MSIVLNIKTKILTTEDKAEAEMSAYRAQLDAEAARIKAEEDARIARENAGRIASLQTAGLSATYIQQYVTAEKQTGTPWQLIAAVHYTETGQRGDTTETSYAGAQGPMQFMPSTFNAYAIDGDGDGVAKIGDVDDAIMTGANYLAANGAASGNFTAALLRYNHDMGYVNHVYSIARSLGLK